MSPSPIFVNLQNISPWSKQQDSYQINRYEKKIVNQGRNEHQCSFDTPPEHFGLDFFNA